MRALTTVLPTLIAPTQSAHIDALAEEDSRGPEKSAPVRNDYYIACSIARFSYIAASTNTCRPIYDGEEIYAVMVMSNI